MDAWTSKVLASATENSPDMPGFPPAAVQERFVGRSGAAALEMVVPFYELINRHMSVTEECNVVDFGAGWGRIARFFQNRIGAGTNFHLADVDPDALEWCRSSRVAGNRVRLSPDGELPFHEGSLDLVYAFSVFSHLSEGNAKHWFDEFARKIRVGGVLIFTIQSLRFLDLVKACHDLDSPNPIEKRIGTYMDDPAEAIRRFNQGDFAFSNTGGTGVLTGDFYGWAAIPQAWLQSQFAGSFDVVEYIDDPVYSEQAIVVARKIA